MVISVDVRERIEKYSVPDPNSGCHLWIGAAANNYPVLNLGKKLHRVTRLLLAEKLDRELLDDEHALHSCDVSFCVNKHHLHVGSHQQNMRELWERKPPRRRGDGVGKSKLTARQVVAIRGASGTLRGLAKEFGVSSTTIFFVRSGKTWHHVDGCAE
jgi:hypothetical protein